MITMPFPRPEASTVFKFIFDDFESAWEALVNRPGEHVGGGNYLFALLAMILLEFACRVCARDASGKRLARLTERLMKIEPKYFTPLPGPCFHSGECTLPGEDPNAHLLAMMFDLIRNGKAHQYQSAIVTLRDGEVDLDFTGAASDRPLPKSAVKQPREYLFYKRICESAEQSRLSLYVRTEWLYVDIRDAITTSELDRVSGVVADVARPIRRAAGSRQDKKPYDFTVDQLVTNLVANGHKAGEW